MDYLMECTLIQPIVQNISIVIMDEFTLKIVQLVFDLIPNENIVTGQLTLNAR